MSIGYTRPLYILPFDHRSSFSKGLFGWTGTLTPEQTRRVADAKAVIYEAFRQSIESGLAKERAGILVDEHFGAAILRDASRHGYITAMPLEKSGQDEFQFEYGDDYAAHIEAFDPTFCKVLVRYNPEGDTVLNLRQAGRLARLSDYLHAHGRLFMFELLVPATLEEMDRVHSSQDAYDSDLRPSLMVGAVGQLQQAGVEPDVWKIEGLDHRGDYLRVAEAARRDGRDHVGCIVLGRGSSEQKVVDWLHEAVGVPGFIGFAVGRTSFWDALVSWRDGGYSREQAVMDIAERYLEWVHVFETPSIA